MPAQRDLVSRCELTQGRSNRRHGERGIGHQQFDIAVQLNRPVNLRFDLGIEDATWLTVGWIASRLSKFVERGHEASDGEIRNAERRRAKGWPGWSSCSALGNLRKQRCHYAVHSIDRAQAFRRPRVLAAREREGGAHGHVWPQHEVTRSKTRNRSVGKTDQFEHAVLGTFRISHPAGVIRAPEQSVLPIVTETAWKRSEEAGREPCLELIPVHAVVEQSLRDGCGSDAEPVGMEMKDDLGVRTYTFVRLAIGLERASCTLKQVRDASQRGDFVAAHDALYVTERRALCRGQPGTI